MDRLYRSYNFLWFACKNTTQQISTTSGSRASKAGYYGVAFCVWERVKLCFREALKFKHKTNVIFSFHVHASRCIFHLSRGATLLIDVLWTDSGVLVSLPLPRNTP